MKPWLVLANHRAITKMDFGAGSVGIVRRIVP
jgi:hypothetical protein